MAIRDAFRSIRESFRKDPPDGQFLDAISDRPERFNVLYRSVQQKEAMEAVDALSPHLQTNRRGLGEQARNIGALALYITQTKNTAVMQKVSDILSENPNHIGASTLVRLTRLNAQGHFGDHDKPFMPAQYVKKDEPYLMAEENHALNHQFFSSSYKDTLYGNRLVRDFSSGQDDLLFSTASSVALRGNGNLHVYDGITQKIGTRYYYEMASIAAHGRNVRLPKVAENRLYNTSGISNEKGVERFLEENEEKSKSLTSRPEWLNSNSAMKKIIDKIEQSGVKINFEDNACFTAYYTQDEKSIHMPPYHAMKNGKKEYTAILLHEIGHATNELNKRVSIDTYGDDMQSRYHEESVAQGISVHLLQKVANAQGKRDEPLVDQKTIKEKLALFVRLQKITNDFSISKDMTKIHDAIHRDVIKGFSSVYPTEQNIKPIEIHAIDVLDNARDTLENLSLIKEVNAERIPEKRIYPIYGKQFAKTLNALEKFNNNSMYSTDPILDGYIPKILEAIKEVKQHVPEGSAYEYIRSSLEVYSKEINEKNDSTQKMRGAQNQNGETTFVRETLLPDLPLIAESSPNAADRLTLKFDKDNSYDPSYLENEYLHIHGMAYKLEDASEKTNSKIGRYALRKGAESLEKMADGVLNAQQYTQENLEKLAKSLSNVEDLLIKFTPQNIQEELKSVISDIQSRFNPDKSNLESKNQNETSEKTDSNAMQMG